MKIALVQMDVAHGQPTENKKHVKEMLCFLKCGILAML